MSENTDLYDDDMLEGLDDFDPEVDGTIPRLQLRGDGAVFVDTLSGEEYPAVDLILLGAVKQRVLWEPEFTGEAVDPLCRARTVPKPKGDRTDEQGGIPGEEFPWAESGLTPEDLSAEGTLDCRDCKLALWDSIPGKEKSSPWCAEQWVFPALMKVDGALVPFIVTFQRSSLTNAKKYVQAFGRTRTPMFTVWTHIELEQLKRGTTKYAGVEFKKGAETGTIEDHREFADTFRRIKGFLTARRSDVLELEPPTEVAAAIGRGSATPPPVAAISEDDVPFEDAEIVEEPAVDVVEAEAEAEVIEVDFEAELEAD